MAMARDGLLPPFFSDVHPRFHTPWKATILTGQRETDTGAEGIVGGLLGSSLSVLLLCALRRGGGRARFDHPTRHLGGVCVHRYTVGLHLRVHLRVDLASSSSRCVSSVPLSLGSRRPAAGHPLL